MIKANRSKVENRRDESDLERLVLQRSGRDPVSIGHGEHRQSEDKGDHDLHAKCVALRILSLELQQVKN